MKIRVERAESKLTIMKERLEELRTNVRNEDARMEKMESNIETIKEYLWELRETTSAREGNDKGKTPMELSPSPSCFPLQGEPPIPLFERVEEVVNERGGMNNIDREKKRRSRGT